MTVASKVIERNIFPYLDTVHTYIYCISNLTPGQFFTLAAMHSIEEHVATNKEYDMTNTHSAMENMQHMDHSVGEFVKINASQKSPSRGPDQHVVCRHCTNIQAIRKKCM